MDVPCYHRRGLELHPFAGHDSAAYLSGYHGLLGVEVTFDDRAGGHQHLGSDPHRSLDPPFDPDHPFGLEIADDGHVARDDRKGYLIGAPAPQLVPLLIAGGVIEDPHQLPSLTMVRGSSETPFCRTSKWRCGAVDRPVFPLRPMTCPGATEAPGCTRMRERWPYMVW